MNKRLGNEGLLTQLRLKNCIKKIVSYIGDSVFSKQARKGSFFMNIEEGTTTSYLFA
jgi:hypothetical protein